MKQSKDDSHHSSILLKGVSDGKDNLKKAKLVLNTMGYESRVVSMTQLGALSKSSNGSRFAAPGLCKTCDEAK